MEGGFTPKAFVLELIEQRGWKPPICEVEVGANGSVRVRDWRVQADGSLKDETRAISTETGARFPVNVMYVDRRGEATKIIKVMNEDDPSPTIQ